ncbi:MAG TPA: hypothetical protein P5531_01550 [Bacteroidales bacterium]|nr:hypothetical protein [Bacteroidales bacterium]HSA42340.1 hypothetical protein [Bacteroidales bacterium]
MDWLEYFKLIGITSLPNVILLSAILFIGKGVIEKYFASSLEKYKTDLALIANKNATVFERIHERKINAITDVHGKLNILYKSLAIYTSQLKFVPTGKSSDEFQTELGTEFFNKYNEFVDSYLVNKLYLSDLSCETIENILKEFRVASHDYSTISFFKNAGVNGGEIMVQAFKDSINASKRVENEFPVVLNDLKHSFSEEIQKFEINR